MATAQALRPGAAATKSKPVAKPKVKATRAPKQAPLWLRVWVAGDLPGVNHGQEGMGRSRHLTAKAQSWAEKVEAAVVHELARTHVTLWRDGREMSEAPLGVRMHFYVAAKRLKNGRLRKLDVDAPVKLTLDHVMAALGLDDERVQALSVWQSVIEDALGAARVGGYGKTQCGAWIEVWKLSAAEIRRIALETPGAPG